MSTRSQLSRSSHGAPPPCACLRAGGLPLGSEVRLSIPLASRSRERSERLAKAGAPGRSRTFQKFAGAPPPLSLSGLNFSRSLHGAPPPCACLRAGGLPLGSEACVLTGLPAVARARSCASEGWRARGGLEPPTLGLEGEIVTRNLSFVQRLRRVPCRRAMPVSSVFERRPLTARAEQPADPSPEEGRHASAGVLLAMPAWRVAAIAVRRWSPSLPRNRRALLEAQARSLAASSTRRPACRWRGSRLSDPDARSRCSARCAENGW